MGWIIEDDEHEQSPRARLGVRYPRGTKRGYGDMEESLTEHLLEEWEREKMLREIAQERAESAIRWRDED